jgi:hypothetical protein
MEIASARQVNGDDGVGEGEVVGDDGPGPGGEGCAVENVTDWVTAVVKSCGCCMDFWSVVICPVEEGEGARRVSGSVSGDYWMMVVEGSGGG